MAKFLDLANFSKIPKLLMHFYIEKCLMYNNISSSSLELDAIRSTILSMKTFFFSFECPVPATDMLRAIAYPTMSYKKKTSS